MSYLLSRKKTPDESGCIQCVTPQSANWGYVGFSVWQLSEGQQLTLPAVAQERCLVLVAGYASISTGQVQCSQAGDRMSPFERRKPWAVYIAPAQKVQIQALTALELAECRAPSSGSYPSRLITPQDIDAEHRGKGCNQRYVHNILPENKPADSLLVVEVYTSEGCTSSWPSHKHDTDNPPAETYLEETYYHRLNPPQGFCMQRVYTDDHSLDEAMAVYDGDVVMVPKGYHPVMTVAGYDNYYLNVMAGPVRQWRFSWQQDHAWINSEAYPTATP